MACSRVRGGLSSGLRPQLSLGVGYGFWASRFRMLSGSVDLAVGFSHGLCAA